MSSPLMNSVLPSAGTPSPAGPVPPLSLSVTSVKPTLPVPAIIKPQTNHAAAAPISLVQENKAKTPEKPKDVPAALPKPTLNGLEETPAVKAPVVAVPEESPAPPAPAAAIVTPVIPPATVAPSPAATPAPAPSDEIPPVAPAPVPLAAVAAPPVVNHAAEPVNVAEVPGAAPPPEPEPAEVAPPAEPSKPKPAKPQAAKRRRERPPAAAAPTEGGTPEKKPRRMRAPVSPYQSPLPEITTVINRSLKVKDNSHKPNDEKLIVFYKNEFLAVRNAEGGFYLCQTMQNIYRTSHKIRIRWLSRDEKESTSDGGIYTRDFYDATDFECILTTVALQKKDQNKYKMPAAELERVESILKRALDVEKGVSEKPAVTEEHPDGIDLSLYRDESQLQKSKRAIKRRRSPSQKSSSPKKAKRSKKTKESSGPSGSKPAKTIAPNKAKPPARKPPAKRAANNPPVVEKKLSRAERSSAREKLMASTVTTTKTTSDKPSTSTKADKNDKIKAKAKVVKGKKKTSAKVEKPVEVKVDKKQDKKKLKSTPPAPVASSSKKADKGKKPVVAPAASVSDKRPPSTRKKGRK